MSDETAVSGFTQTPERTIEERHQDFARRFATRFEFGWHGHNICIERYTNHGRLLSDGRWVVVRHLFPLGTSSTTNPLYLNGNAWLYKNGQTWDSWQEALEHLYKYGSRPGTNGWEMIREDPHGKFDRKAL